MEIKARILEAADELFMQYGFKSITMDEIARHLGISKKTIYQFFEDKDQIVVQCLSQHFDCEKEAYAEILSRAKDPVEEFVIEVQQFKLIMKSINPAILFELRKYYPAAWQVFQEHKEKWIIQSIVSNLQKGIEQDLYRSDIDPHILARLRIEEVSLGFNLSVTHGYNLKDVQLQFLEHFLHGILTDKGRELFYQYQSIHEITKPNQK